MPEFPGVYVEELPGTFRSISGISPNIGVVGLVNRENVLLGSAIGRLHSGGTTPDWKYVNIRREMIFIEHSLSQQLQWVVFENNGPALWSRVTQSIDSFLTNQWMSGALQGSKKDEAFFVTCNRTTMTQDDIDNGRLIVLVGVAPIMPAEFVILRICCMTASVQP